MTVVDTSFLVALHKTDDRFHEDASRAKLFGDRFLVPWEVWVEFCQVLMWTRPMPDVERILERLLEGPFHIARVLDEREVAAVAAKARSVQKTPNREGQGPLSLVDLVVLTIASRYTEKVYTFDQSMIAAIREGLFPGARVG